MKTSVNQSVTIISSIPFCLYQMNEQFDCRSLLLRIQDLLSQSDRSQLLFLLGEDIPRHPRDDPSICEALRVLDSMLDRTIISNEHCTNLINVFTLIQCHDAAKRLQGFFIFILNMNFVVNELICAF